MPVHLHGVPDVHAPADVPPPELVREAHVQHVRPPRGRVRARVWETERARDARRERVRARRRDAAVGVHEKRQRRIVRIVHVRTTVVVGSDYLLIPLLCIRVRRRARDVRETRDVLLPSRPSRRGAREASREARSALERRVLAKHRGGFAFAERAFVCVFCVDGASSKGTYVISDEVPGARRTSFVKKNDFVRVSAREPSGQSSAKKKRERAV